MRRLLFLALLATAHALAQPFPTKPIRLVVPLVPGGNQDIVARAVAEEMSKGLGQQVVVENRPGQSAIIGTQFVKSAPADGYTLLSVAVTFARVPAVVKAAGYDPRTDFAGVSLVCRIPQVLVVNAANPAHTVQELIAQAKAEPGKVTYGSSGNGSTGHVAAEMFMRMTGVKLLHVTYKGNAQALIDVMGGQIAMMFDQVSTSAGHIKGGKIRGLGVTTLTRSAVLPDVPTLDEQGLKGFEDVTWNGIVAPAGTPRDVLMRLHAEITRATNQAQFRRKYLERGIEIVASPSPEAFSSYIRSEADGFARLVKDAGISAE
ncbi:MAG TPA: tripartite tricarboxylate transporter substrate binding protein [Burkholderiales bacterium]|nr:tripartite tricarboxylate transporter substrate binding protein [Burkholderiales bacterium]